MNIQSEKLKSIGKVHTYAKSENKKCKFKMWKIYNIYKKVSLYVNP